MSPEFYSTECDEILRILATSAIDPGPRRSGGPLSSDTRHAGGGDVTTSTFHVLPPVSRPPCVFVGLRHSEDKLYQAVGRREALLRSIQASEAAHERYEGALARVSPRAYKLLLDRLTRNFFIVLLQWVADPMWADHKQPNVGCLASPSLPVATD
jgi:hypothetical protein